VGNENFDVILDLDGSNDVQTRYLRGDVVDELFGRAEMSGPAAYWHLNDHLGSVRDIVDDTGDLLETISYDAFGNITARADGDGDPLTAEDPTYRGRYAWTGRELDAETGLQYNRARSYGGASGRWLTQDSLGFDAGDLNLYRYAHNCGFAVDPSGFETRVGSGYKPMDVNHVPVVGKWGLLYWGVEFQLKDSETKKTAYAGEKGGYVLQRVRYHVNLFDAEGKRVTLKSHFGPGISDNRSQFLADDNTEDYWEAWPVARNKSVPGESAKLTETWRKTLLDNKIQTNRYPRNDLYIKGPFKDLTGNMVMHGDLYWIDGMMEKDLTDLGFRRYKTENDSPAGGLFSLPHKGNEEKMENLVKTAPESTIHSIYLTWNTDKTTIVGYDFVGDTLKKDEKLQKDDQLLYKKLKELKYYTKK